jgi:hypothetical protein
LSAFASSFSTSVINVRIVDLGRVNLPENALHQFPMNILFVKWTRPLWYKHTESKDEINQRNKAMLIQTDVHCKSPTAEQSAGRLVTTNSN